MVLPETAIGALLSASLQVLFDRLASHQLLEFFRSRECDETLLHRLETVLLSVLAVLSDAEEKQITNSIVKRWVNELKDAVYRAEDFLDEMFTNNLQRQMESESRGINKQVQSRNSRLKDIISRLEHVANTKDGLGLKESTLGVNSFPRWPSTSLVDESKVFGRHDDKQKIKKLLLSDCTDPNEREIPVTAIVGVGGVGKTTLAQLLFNDPDVKEHFSTGVWVHVSENFDVFKITETIFEPGTCHSQCKITDLNVLQVKLKEKLAGKRFLLILDDVWNENFLNWDVLKKPFGDGDVSSRIIVTTRSQSVASIMHSVHVHPLQPLSDEDCLLVFEKFAFRSANIRPPQNLRKIGEQIVKKCRGLPLAAKTLGGLLCTKGDQTSEWNKILKSNIWDLSINESDILPSLMLSYYYLPPYLKQCFAYCSIFPKGYAFEKEKLVLLWMAQGFLQQPTSEKRMEEVGREYFNELLSRSLFQQLGDNKSRFIMHDLISELAQFASGEFCFKIEEGMPLVISERVRHFSYVMDQIDSIQKFETLHELKFLRTFLPLSFSSNPGGALSLNKMIIEHLLLTMKCLRVLSLCHYEISELPDTFDKLKQLRYLDLSRTKIEKLPQSTCFLYNLQTLLLTNCFNLIELPENMRNLSKLAHLDVSGTKLKKMPPDLGKLKNLQTLPTFVVSDGSSIHELRDLQNLQGKLSIFKLQNVSEAADAEAAKLKDKKNIEELVFSWNIDSLHDPAKNGSAVLEKLQPHKNIEILTIDRYGGKEFPDWLGNSSILTNVVFLRLTGCKNCSSVPSLGQLPSLKKLHIAKMESLAKIGAEFYGNGSSTSIRHFKSLEILHFEDMPKWEQWLPSAVEDGEFPSLQELHIQNCGKLAKNLPRYLPSLTLLHIEECKILDFLDDSRRYTELQTLHIIGCDSLESFPLGFFNKVAYLQIQKCSQLRYIEVSNDLHQVQELKFLGDLEVSDCSNLKHFTGGLLAPNLKSFSVSKCRSLELLPVLTSLETLALSDCRNLKSFQNDRLPPNLRSLFIMSCDHLTPKKNWGLNEMDSLTSLTITGGSSDVKSFPEKGLLPASLISLQVTKFPKLETLDLRELQLLTSLRTLEINSCASLKDLSEGTLPSSLANLIINECPLLKPKCQEKGDYWEKINHIPNIEMF
ncbi:putative disease resistance RPP13-like protein 1 [Pistacia vera]|uniref:putative disease resistance RPP13-like protein 1 n=1 Tax=Pistacia vera TaxID=55513 RepID=UPI001263D1DA|nr:putative disease resistance RPP13-like protein 1 [Pistacia vera]